MVDIAVTGSADLVEPRSTAVQTVAESSQRCRLRDFTTPTLTPASSDDVG
jgi:hypothetical protein